MPAPTEQPYYYPGIHPDETPGQPGKRPPHPDARFRRTVFAFAGLLLVGAVVLLGVALLTRTASPVAQIDASATSEAVQFATVQANRTETRVSQNATSTAVTQITEQAQSLAHASSTAQAVETLEVEKITTGTALAYAYKTSTAASIATEQAPPTLTAQAQEFEADQAKAQATAQAMDAAAQQVFGPVSGTLDHGNATSPVCLNSGLQLHNFIAQAAFYNPYGADQHAFDYGFTFTNIGDDTEYRVRLDSGPGWATTLFSTGYDITLRDSTSTLGLGEADFNFIKLYVNNDVVHLFVNGQYVTTVALADLNFGNAITAQHEPRICMGYVPDDMQAGSTTRYQDFTVWSAP